MLKFFKDHWAILTVLILCFWAVKALFVPGFFPIHDDTQIARLYELDKAIREGQIPPRWVSDLGFGYGFPLFNFYAPFVYYIGEVFKILGFSLILSTKIVMFLGFLFSAVSMYLWARNHFDKIPSIFAAVIYTYAPYHAVDLYVRGGLSEFYSFIFIPAIFWSFELLFKKKKLVYSITSGILLALLVLTHNLTAFMSVIFFLVYFVFLYLNNRRNTIGFLTLSVLIGVSLSCYYWLPALTEKSYTLIDKVNLGELFDYRLHFVYLRQLLDSTWGYGGSIYGLHDGLSFQIGKIQILMVLSSALILLWSFLKKKKFLQLKTAFVIFLLFVISIYLTTFYSQWIWDRISLLSYIQFPWRFLLFASVFSSFLGAFVISELKKSIGDRKAVIAAVMLGAASIFLVSSYFQPQSYLFVDDSFYTDEKKLKWDVSKTSFEYLPKGVPTKLSDIKTTQIDIGEKDISENSYEILKGEGKVEVVIDKSHLKSFKINSKTGFTIQINTFSFPGWTVELDKEVIAHKESRMKLIVLDIPAGEHTVKAEFKNTLPRAVGNAVSLVALFNLVGFGFFRLWKK